MLLPMFNVVEMLWHLKNPAPVPTVEMATLQVVWLFRVTAWAFILGAVVASTVPLCSRGERERGS